MTASNEGTSPAERARILRALKEVLPAELRVFNGDAYLDDPVLWLRRHEEWSIAREQWAADRGLDYFEVFGDSV